MVRASYTTQEKLNVIEYAKSTSQADAARKFNINKSQISRWVNNSSIIKKAPSGNRRIKSRTSQASTTDNPNSCQDRRKFSLTTLLEVVSVNQSLIQDELYVAEFLSGPILKARFLSLCGNSDAATGVKKQNQGLNGYFSMSVDTSQGSNIKILYS